MDRILVDFVKALRGTGVRIATSETLDAIQVLDLIGYSNRTYLKLALANTLAKSEQEKQLFDTCFEQFFSFNDLSALEKQQPAAAEDRSLLRSILSTSAEPEEPKSALGELLLSGDGQAIATAMAQAAAEAEVGNIRVITQKGLYGRRMMIGMGLESMEQEMWAAEASPEPAQQKLGAELRNARELLREEVKHYVERQYLLQAAGDGRALRESVMMETSLENLREFKDVQLLVRKLAKKLVATHSRRRRVFQRGKLNVRSTIRHHIRNPLEK